MEKEEKIGQWEGRIGRKACRKAEKKKKMIK